MYTFDLVRGLNDEEVREVFADSRLDRRPSLRPLFVRLLDARREGEPEKEDLFAIALGRPYAKEKDYLLRNELRHLNRLIESGMVRGRVGRLEAGDDPEFGIILAEELLERGSSCNLEGLYERGAKLLRSEIDRAVERFDYGCALRLHGILIRRLLNASPRSLEIMRETHGALRRGLELLRQHRALEEGIARYRLASIETMLRSSNVEIGAAGEPEMPINPLARYYTLMAEAFGASGPERVTIAAAAVEAIESIEGGTPQIAREKGTALNNLAVACMLDRDYEHAGRTFERLFEYVGEADQPIQAGYLYNYVAVLMRIGEYERVIALLEEHPDIVRSSPSLAARYESIRCYAWLFLRRPERAFEALPEAPQTLPELDEQYLRYAYIILPWLNGDPEGAMRETQNLQRFFKRNEEAIARDAETALAKLFRAFFTATGQTSREGVQRKLMALREKIGEFKSAWSVHADFLPLLWLEREAEELLKRSA